MINGVLLKKTFKIVIIVYSIIATFIENKGNRMNRMRNVIFLLILFCNGNSFLFAQPIYNDCFQSLEICPNTLTSITNIGANKTFCPDCEDDFVFCFPSNNTIWLKFTTNSTGGDVQVDFSNLIFETDPGQDQELQATIFSTLAPCNGNSYVQVGNCVSNATSNFSLNALALAANMTYYIVVNGDKSGLGVNSSAECTCSVLISGTGVNRVPPTITINSSSQNICQNDQVNLFANMLNCSDSTGYRWYINGVLVATTVDSIYQTTTLSTGDVISVSTTCFTLCPQTITSVTSPYTVYTFSVDAGPDQYITSGQSAQLQGATSAPLYSWSPDFLLTNSTILNPVAIPTETTTYTLTAQENGCTLFDDVVVYIETELVIPTTFSPNNDDINDVFEIVGIEKYPNNLLYIYDRWGQEVFQKSGYSYDKAWKGEIHDRELASGVYFYVLELRDKDKQIKKGSVTVIR